MTYDRLALAVLALGLLFLSAWPVDAQAAPIPCNEIPDCADRYREAQRLSKSGAPDQALQRFLELHRQYGDPATLYPIAVMLDRLDRPAEAAAAYQSYLDAGVETDPARLDQIQEQLRKAKERANPPSPSPKIPAESPRPAATPLHKRWWVWTGVGVVVVGVAIGVGLGVYARQPDLGGLPEARPFGG